LFVYRGEEVPNSFIAHLIKNDKLSLDQINVNVATLLFAGVDTTAVGFAWLLYHLAGNPQVQDKLHAELAPYLKGRNLAPGDLPNLPYLRACIKESARLDPVAPMVPRAIKESIELKGYLIPAGSIFFACSNAIARDPNIFPNPTAYHPDRWMTAERAKKTDPRAPHEHPYAILPFSVG